MMIFGNQSGQDVNALRELMRRGLLKESDLANLAVSESEPVRAPNALAQMMSPLESATAGQGFQGLASGQGVVQATNPDGTQGTPIRIDSGPPVAQGAPRDWSRVEVDTPNGRGYYGKDGKIYTPDGAVTTMQPVGTQARRNAEQDRLMKIAEMQARIAQSESATRENDAQVAAMGTRGNATPTMTEVVDPKDPSRLLRVDAKTYRGGSLGEAGVLGASGKEPTAAKREETANNGRDGLAADLQLIRDNYAKLAEAGDIPSTEKGGLSNLSARIQSSGVGQMLGGAMGTQSQAARNEIQAAKRRLLSSIKNITGASAQEMNSNVELKTWMDSLGDPQGILESNLGILDAIENKYIKAKDYKTANSGNPAPDTKMKSQALFDAKKAIAAGASREAVIKRLRENGITETP